MVYATDTRKIKFGDGEHLWRDLPTYEGSAYTLDENNNANFSGVVSSNSKELATKEYVDNSVSSVGSGDMLKSVYDKDNDGIIDDIALLQYYGTTNITISDSSYFTVNSTGETITGLTAEGKTQTELVIPYEINGKKITTLFSGSDGISSAPVSILNGNSTITKVVIPKSVTTLGAGAFYNCNNLIDVNIPDSITSIGNYAFNGCTSLTSINIPNNVTSIGNYAFGDCTSLTSINIPNNVTSIGYYTFGACSSLTSINIPSSVTSIGDGAFQGCTSLTKIEIPNSVTSIENSAFYVCTSLTSVNIPNSVTSIGNNAFQNCTNLTIYCEQGSYAETYAKGKNISIVYTDIKDIGSNVEIVNNLTTSDSTKALSANQGKILNDTKANVTAVLTKTNTSEFTPTANYHPATKKYVDDIVGTKSNANDVYTKTEVDELLNNKAKKPVVTTITIPTTGWTTSTDTNGITYYTKNITDSILTSTGYPIADVVLPSDIAAARLQSEAYQKVNKITVNDGSVDLYCFDSLPTVSFQIRIQLLYI